MAWIDKFYGELLVIVLIHQEVGIRYLFISGHARTIRELPYRRDKFHAEILISIAIYYCDPSLVVCSYVWELFRQI